MNDMVKLSVVWWAVPLC